MPYEQRAVELAEYLNFCRCTEDHQFDQRCDGTRCVGQEQAIKAAEECAKAVERLDDGPITTKAARSYFAATIRSFAMTTPERTP